MIRIIPPVQALCAEALADSSSIPICCSGNEHALRGFVSTCFFWNRSERRDLIQ